MTARRLARIRILATCMSAVMITTATGCSAPLSSSSPAPDPGGNPTSLYALDGETLFTGIFFGQGDVALAFPEIWNRNEFAQARKLTPSQRASVDELTRALGAAHPGFFDRFATEIQSGDHLRARAVLVEGAADVASLLTGTDLGSYHAECFDFFLFGTFFAVASYLVAVLGAFYFLAGVAQVTVYQTGMIGATPSPVVCPPYYTLVGGTCVYDPSGGGGGGGGGGGPPPGADVSGAPQPAPRPDVGSGIDPNFRLVLEEYVDLIAQRLALDPAR